MADIIIYWKQHWFDRATPQRQTEVNQYGKFDCRNEKGDIIEINTTRRLEYCKNEKLRVICVEDRTLAQQKYLMQQWKREIQLTRTLNNEKDGIFEYSITIPHESDNIIVKEQFKKPGFVDILTKTTNSLTVRLRFCDIQSSKSQEKYLAKRDEFEARPENYISDLGRTLKKHRYKFDPMFPLAVRFDSKNWEDWLYMCPWSEVEPYLIDKQQAARSLHG